ncbi:hypothetical protein C3F09_02870 [candidate division GN15 bacterium]|uniref:BioF2-like acetyltransferase domain-containing protein n=1 Tax=candidate division GN15 bacterium TaxID=2072418 RepID=A0A855X4U4_9BACT|nr:MAG: hypothetical protein C3F09_02870 [candidate division GN15 bacterium]
MRSVERSVISELPESLRTQLDSFSFFGSTGFAKIWEAVGGCAVCWVLRDSESVIGVLTGVEFRSRPLTRFQSMPDGCYARLFCAAGHEAERGQAARMMLAAVRKAGYARIYLADYFRDFDLESEVNSQRYETPVVDISSPDWQPPDAKLQSEIRKAEREGVVVTAFSTESHMDKFIDLMTRAESRHQRPPRYSREFFLKLAGLAAIDDRVRWYWVEHNGAPVVSHIYLVDKTMALNWQIYFDKEFSSLKANQLVMFRAAKALAASGVTHLNLGATPPDAESVRAYKQKWGGEVYSYPITVHTSWLGRLL